MKSNKINHDYTNTDKSASSGGKTISNRKKVALIVALALTMVFSILIFAGCDDTGGGGGNQEQGVAEGDIVRYADDKIIKLAFDGLTVCETANGLKLYTSAKKNNIKPIEIITHGNVLAVFFYEDGLAIDDVYGHLELQQKLIVEYYDMNADISAAEGKFVPLRRTQLIWKYSESRVIGEKLYLYANATHDANTPSGDRVILDSVSGKVMLKDSHGTAMFASLDLSKLSEAAYTFNIEHTNIDSVYFTETDIFFTSTRYTMSTGGCMSSPSPQPSGQYIKRLSLEDFSVSAYTDNAPRFSNRRNLYFKDGYLFAVPDSVPRLIVYDRELKEVAKLTNIADGETVKAVSFSGNLCYMVTFRQVDPLFKIDISDPLKPQVLGALKIEGYSASLIEYREGRMLGIGINTELNRLKITMFDTSGDEPLELNTLELPSYTHNSYTFDKKAYALCNDYIAFSANDRNNYSKGVLVNINNDILSFGAEIDHRFTGYNTDEVNRYRGAFSIKRFAVRGDYLYCISDAYITKHDGEFNLLETADTRLAEVNIKFQWTDKAQQTVTVEYKLKYGDMLRLPDGGEDVIEWFFDGIGRAYTSDQIALYAAYDDYVLYAFRYADPPTEEDNSLLPQPPEIQPEDTTLEQY